ncbi:MAG TPA: hypothetical protein VHM89_06890 [Acidimicrobiales bacterium]|nr:hypothetical protein [Acidimicrobiales bacterium]
MARQPGGGRVELAFLAATAATTSVSAGVVLRLWRADLRVPFVYFFDAVFNATAVKSILEHGWFLHNPSLGAPAGLDMHDFPLGGENLQFLLIKILGLVSGDWATVMNAYFLLGFVLTALTAYVALRQTGSSRWPALALASLFTLLPYHFVLGETQLFQSAYYVVPLGVLLVVDVLGWDVWQGPFLAFAAPDRRRVGLRRWVVRAGVAAVIASAGSYYAPFTVVLVVVAACLRVLAGDRRTALRALAVVGMLVAVLAANNAPSLLYRHDHGGNAEVADRAPGESDLYALHVVDLFLPIQAHRLAPFAALKERLDGLWPASPVWPAPQTPLGLAGAAGLALSLVAVASVAGVPRRPPTPARARMAQVGLLNLAAIVVGVATGLSSLLAVAGVTEVRVWSRLSVVIGFLALVAAGQAVEAVWPRLAGSPAASRLPPQLARSLGAGVAVLAVVLGVLDQTQPGMAPPYAAIGDLFAGDRDFVAGLERRMPAGSAIFQLPLAGFPEHPTIASMPDYGLLRGYLHSKTLRWSYPSIRGRPADWAWSLGGRSLEAVLDGATAAGFTGLYVDRAGFADRAAGLEAEMGRIVGPPTLASEQGLVFWDLRDRAAAQRMGLGAAAVDRLRRHVLAPVVPRWAEGFGRPVAPSWVPEPVPGQRLSTGADFVPYPALPGRSFETRRPAVSPAVLELRNPLPERRPVYLRLTVTTTAAKGDVVTFAAGGTAPVHVTAGPDARPGELALSLAPGTTRVRITSAAGAGFSIGNVLVVDDGSTP